EEGRKTERRVSRLRNVGSAWSSDFTLANWLPLHPRSRIFDQAEHTVSQRRDPCHQPLLTRRSSLNPPDPAGAAACPAPGRLQSRRHRIPLPWPDRRASHESRKVSCCKKPPAGELRTWQP